MKSNTLSSPTPSKSVDISVNVTTHCEGILAHKTLRSIHAGIIYAHERGIRLELNIASDNTNDETLRAVQSFITDHPDIAINWYRLQVGDVSASRNYLIDHSKGKYLSFFDSDDFFTENYLYEAHTFAETQNKPAIYSPRYLIVFEGDHYLVEKLDSTSPKAVAKNMFEINYYIGQSFIHRDIFKKIRFVLNGPGYGMEDWHFSCEALALGYQFYNVPNTIFFYRRKRVGSLLNSHIQSGAVIHPTKLFSPAVYAALPSSSPIHVKAPVISQPKPIVSIKHVVVSALRRNEVVFKYSKQQYVLHRNIAKAIKLRYMANRTAQSVDAVVETPIPQRLIDIGFTVDLVHFWGRLNRFEPLIRASLDMLTYIPIVGYPLVSKVSNQYHKFCKQYQGADIADIVLVPHLIRGGADLAAINLIQQLNKHTGSYTLIITTVDVDSPWLAQVKALDKVICIESKTFFNDISEEGRIQFIVRLIQNWDVKRLSVINSEVGYKLATRYGRMLSDNGCAIYLHTYAFNMTDDGYLFNWLANGLVDAYNGVDMYVTDSNAYRKQLMEINGFSKDKITTLYSPIKSAIVRKTDYAEHKRVLWASRICDDKLIEVLVEVGKELASADIELDVYGSIDEMYATNDRFIKMIEPYSNIAYKGGFEGFSSLPINKYDMLLLTTKNEGMPFIVLEACQSNIYVISANVGGIPECIKEGVNGNLVRDKFDPKSYVNAILNAYSERSYADSKNIDKYNKQILSRHSLDSYGQAVKNLLNI